MIKYLETPVKELKDALFDRFGVRLLIKREDLNNPFVSGNKWWKLKNNLEEARKLGLQKLLTFGGAYSNHIFATAAAARDEGFESVGIIRGEASPQLNPTLTFAKACGMQLYYVSRESYRNKTTPDFIEFLQRKFGDFYLIPEGGTNALAVKGCNEFARKVLGEVSFDSLVLPVGTAGTMAGFISAMPGEKELLGITVLKNGEFLNEVLLAHSQGMNGNWSLLTQYHHGGYAKTSGELANFIDQFETRHRIPLEPVYTGKLMFAVFEEIKKERFRRGTTILIIHTGGLQGRSGVLDQAYPNKS